MTPGSLTYRIGDATSPERDGRPVKAKKRERQGGPPDPDMRGQRFGLLIVVAMERRSGPRGLYKWYARCECDCGGAKAIHVASLRRGATTSCGCRRDQYAKMTGSSSPSYTGYGGLSGTRWTGIRAGARDRGLELTITPKDAWLLFQAQGGTCPLSGRSLNLSRQGNASLDRIDSGVGYVRGNVAWVDRMVNLTKGRLGVAEYVDLCRHVARFQSGFRPTEPTGDQAMRPRASSRWLTGAASPQFTGFMEIRGRWWSHKVAKAAARGLAFDLSIESVWALYLTQGKRCAISGLPIEFASCGGKTTASIDRINGERGYHADNIQLVHGKLNSMRLTYSMRDFVTLCLDVAAHRRRHLCDAGVDVVVYDLNERDAARYAA